MPLLLLVGIIAVVWGGLAAAEELIKGEGIRSFKVSGGACLFEAFGATGFRLMVFPALLMVDAIDVANLSSVWLGSAIVVGLVAMGGKLSARHVAGILCFGAGALVVVLDGLAVGHVLALCGGLIWGWHVGRSSVRSGAGRQADAIGSLVTGGVLIYLSWLIETPWGMGAGDVQWIFWLVLTENVGYVLWRYGARHGGGRRTEKVSVLFMPVVGVLWIWVLGGVSLNAGHVVATAAVTMAGLILSPHVFKEGKKARHGEEAGRLS